MSLRRRLAVVLALGLSALVIAFAAIGHLLISSNNARERTAQATAQEGAQALAERVESAALVEGPDTDGRPRLQSTAAGVLRPVPGAAGGYCTRNGAILATAGRLFRGEGRPGEGRHAPPADVRDAVAGLCMKARPGAPAQGRFESARGVDWITAVAVGDRGGAWFLSRAHTRGADEGPAWPFEVVLLALAAVALAAFTIDAMMALRRGADELQGALVKLQDDLRAPVPRPRAQELGEIASGLSAMAAHLADARDRERALEATVARGQRLAALGRVVAGVAHEVRNPLAGMKLRLDLLARTNGLDGAAKEDVVVCLGEIARLNRLVESLLVASRAKTLAMERLDLAQLADDRIARAAPVAAKTGVRLSRRGAGSAVSDPDALAGAVDNLLRNAIEASPAGSEVVVYIGAAHDGTVVLDVEDAGPGIPEARRTELFEPFFTTKPEGTGLGLWISRLLLEAKGASLRYDRVGDRTRMRIAFVRGEGPQAPVAVAEPPHPAAPSPPAAPPAGAPSARKLPPTLGPWREP
jgi:signal transduction histidine kinase